MSQFFLLDSELFTPDDDDENDDEDIYILRDIGHMFMLIYIPPVESTTLGVHTNKWGPSHSHGDCVNCTHVFADSIA